jgi:hypothetical protein
MLAEISPAQRRAFEKPEVRAKVLEPIRQERLQGAGRRPRKGPLPAAAVGLFLPYLTGGEEEGT